MSTGWQPLDPILIDVPYSFDTERLTIRGPLPGDGKQVREAALETRDDLLPWMSWAVNMASEEEQEVRIRQRRVDFLARKELLLLLFLKGTDTFVGSSGLHDIDWTVPRFEIGYWVRKSFAGQGYVTEAVNGITKMAFETLHAERVEILCDAKNTRSAAVARRAGYALEATHRSDERNHITGELRDTLRFVMLRPDFMGGGNRYADNADFAD